MDNSTLRTYSPNDARIGDIYSPAGKKSLMDRILRYNMTKVNKVKPVQINQWDGEVLTIDPPYGYIPFGMKASAQKLKEAIKECGIKKYQFAQSGDYYRMWLYARRQRLLAGILNHLITFNVTKGS